MTMMTVTTASAMCMVAEPEDSAIVSSTQKATNTSKGPRIEAHAASGYHRVQAILR